MHYVSAALEGFLVAMREGIEVALVLGMLLAVLQSTGRRTYGRYALAGLAAAVLASFGAAAAVMRSGLDIEHPLLEGGLMLAAATLVASLVVWMHRARRTIRRRMTQRIDALVGRTDSGRPTLRAALGVFGFAFLMVLREGIETVLFLTALVWAPGGSAPASLGGAGGGLLLAAVFGILLVRGSLRVPVQRFFGVTSLVLLLLAGRLVAGGVHELLEAGVFGAAPFWEALVAPVASRIASYVVLGLVIVLPLGALAWDRWRAAPALLAAPEQPNGARP